MDAHNFAYWLNGFVEMTGGDRPSEAQWASIRGHLALVFTPVGLPPMDQPGPAGTPSWAEHTYQFT